jgi:hypothetical protein
MRMRFLYLLRFTLERPIVGYTVEYQRWGGLFPDGLYEVPILGDLQGSILGCCIPVWLIKILLFPHEVKRSSQL